ncbi:unnamed protein product [Boreogadus saida]
MRFIFLLTERTASTSGSSTGLTPRTTPPPVEALVEPQPPPFTQEGVQPQLARCNIGTLHTDDCSSPSPITTDYKDADDTAIIAAAWRHWSSLSQHPCLHSAIAVPYFSRGSPFSRRQFLVYYTSFSVRHPVYPLPNPRLPDYTPTAEPLPVSLPVCY